MNTRVESESFPRAALGLLSSLIQLAKPGVTRLVLVTTACGAAVAPGKIELLRLLWTLLGTMLVVAAANALNMYLERDSDALMTRTKDRPLPSGKLAPEVALWFGVSTSLLGMALLWLLVNPETALIAAIALLSYVLVYTPLKRVTPLALHVGAVPGALPPVIGWASVTGSVAPGALAMFAILFVWQLPHFLAIAIFREREYAEAGLKVLPAVRGQRRAIIEAVVYSVALLLVSLTPLALGMAGVAYGAVALLLGAAFLALAVSGLFTQNVERWARRLFFASMPYLVLVFAVLVAF